MIIAGIFEYTARATLTQGGKSQTFWASSFQRNGRIKVNNDWFLYGGVNDQNKTYLEIKEQKVMSFVSRTRRWVVRLDQSSGSCTQLAKYTAALTAAQLQEAGMSHNAVKLVCNILLDSHYFQSESICRTILEKYFPELQTGQTLAILKSHRNELSNCFFDEKNVNADIMQSVTSNNWLDEILDWLLKLCVSSNSSLLYRPEAIGYTGMFPFTEVIWTLLQDQVHELTSKPATTIITLLANPQMSFRQRDELFLWLQKMHDHQGIDTEKSLHRRKGILELVSGVILDYCDIHRNDYSPTCSATDAAMKALISFTTYVLTQRCQTQFSLRSRANSSENPGTGSTLIVCHRHLLKTVLYCIRALPADTCDIYGCFVQCIKTVIFRNYENFGHFVVDSLLRCFPRTQTNKQRMVLQLLSSTAPCWTGSQKVNGRREEDPGFIYNDEHESQRRRERNFHLFRRFLERIGRCAASSHIAVASDALNQCNPKNCCPLLSSLLVEQNLSTQRLRHALSSPDCVFHWNSVIQTKANDTLGELSIANNSLGVILQM